ncbi:MAG: hypothetical protein ACQESK_02885 [Bacteroidota bacterium]
MKYLKMFSLLILISLISCSENKPIEEKRIAEDQAQKEIPAIDMPEMSPFLIPSNHELFELENLADLLAFYPKIDQKYGKEDYVENLKRIAIDAIFFNGLLEENNETILFYVQELADASLSLPNIENFNEAILELESRKVDARQLKPMVLEFSRKHKDFIENKIDIEDKEERLALLNQLQSRYNKAE